MKPNILAWMLVLALPAILVVPIQGDLSTNNYQFVKEGDVIQTIGFGHLHVTLNLRDVCDQHQRLRDVVEFLRLNLTGSSSTRLRPKLLATFEQLDNEVARSDNVITLVEHWFHTKKRSAFSAAAGLVGVGLSLFSMMEVNSLRDEVQSLRGETDTILLSLDRSDLAIQRNSEDISRLRRSTQLLTEELSKVSETMKVTRIISSLKHTISMHTMYFTAVQQTLRSLLQNSLDPEIIDLKLLVKRGFQLASNGISDLMRNPISWIVKEKDLNIFIHVPLRRSSMLSLYRYLDLPQYWNGIQAKITPRNGKDFLAIDEERLIGIELSKVELDSCLKFRGEFLCENINVLTRDLKTTCCGALLFGKKSDIMSQCEIIFQPAAKEFLTQINASAVAIYVSDSDRKAHFLCDQGKKSSVQALSQGENILNVNGDCVLTTDSHTFVPRQSISMTREVRINIPDAIEVKDFLEDLDEAKVKEVFRLLRETQTPEVGSLDLIRRQLDRQAKNDEASRWTYGHVTVTLVTVVVTLCLGSYIAILRYLHKKKNKKEDN